MSSSPIHNLRADDLGRFILDLHTPAERTIGRMFGCFYKLAVIISIILFLSIVGSEFGAFSKLARIIGLFLVTGFFYYCRRNVDCYYVLDDVGGQLLYHFSAIMIVSEDPIANLEDVVGIGVTYAGQSATSQRETWAVVFCLSDGTVIRVSDFFELPERANAIAADLAELIKVPTVSCNHGERKIVAVENGQMIQKIDDSFVSSVSKDRATGCLMTLFVVPYAFWPTIIIFMLTFMIVAGASTEKSIDYYREQKNYAYIDSDGNLLPPLDRRLRKNRSRNESSVNNSVNISAGQIVAEKISLIDELASGTIVPGVGIIGLVSIGEEMHVVLNRFNRPVPVVEFPEKTGYIKHLRKYVSPPEIREDFLDGAISILFVGDKHKVMKVSRIRIFCGKNLPYKTADKISFGASAKKTFNLGDGKGNFADDENREFQRIHPGASFFTGFRSVFGVEFKEKGIAYVFSGDALTEITITEGQR